MGGSATGEIEFHDDRDWFAVVLEADRTYRIDLKGSPNLDGTLRNPYLRGDLRRGRRPHPRHDRATTVAPPKTALTFVAPEAGTYYVAAGATAWHLRRWR